MPVSPGRQVGVLFIAPFEGLCKCYLLVRYILPLPKAGFAHSFVALTKIFIASITLLIPNFPCL